MRFPVLLIFTFLIFNTTAFAQLYAPSGTLGTSTTVGVGINTSNPTVELEILGNAPTLRLDSETNAAGGAKIRLTEFYWQGAYLHYEADANRLDIGMHSLTNTLESDDRPALSIMRESRNVGIGTTNPETHKLLVVSEPGFTKAPLFSMTSDDKSITGINSSMTLHNSSLVDGNWARLHFSMLNTAGSEVGGISLAANYTSHAAGQESADFVIATKNAGEYAEKFRLTGNGNLGLNTSVENFQSWAKLQVNLDKNGDAVYLNNLYAAENTNAVFRIDAHANHGNTLRVQRDGKVGIGMSHITEDYQLAVNGTIGARKVKVEATSWPDFVFEENYNLPTLSELEQFIKAHKHLPDVPSEAEVLEKGVELGEMNATLLRKIEELTLYTIQQEKALHEQQRKLEKKEEQMAELLKRVELLEQQTKFE